MERSENLRRMILGAIFSALIVVMTFIPNTGYISTGPIEITTLHIVVIIGAVSLGGWYGGFLGLVWGVTCFLRAFMNPAWIMFTNPLISVLPRIIVGLAVGFAASALSKSGRNKYGSAALCAALGTLLNTVLVLSAIFIFGGMITAYESFFEMFKTIFVTIISLNGGVELVAAIVLVPILLRAIHAAGRKS